MLLRGVWTHPVLLLPLAVGVGVVHVGAQAGVAGGTGDTGDAVRRVLSAHAQVRLRSGGRTVFTWQMDFKILVDIKCAINVKSCKTNQYIINQSEHNDLWKASTHEWQIWHFWVYYPFKVEE